jgi:predicted nucleic acid-binding protein
MKRVFADTSYWIAVINRRDGLAGRAQEVRSRLGNARIVTTHEVLAELLNGFSEKHGAHLRSVAVAVVRAILDAPDVDVIGQSVESFLSGFGRYEDRPDKGYSLTDCVSMNAMDGERIHQVLTADRHFRQEGYDALLL